MDDEENELIPGLDDPRSVPLDVRIARYEAYLRDWTDFELAVRIAATNAILLEDATFLMGPAESALESLAASNKEFIQVLEQAKIGCRLGAVSTKKFILVSKELAEKKAKHSKAGAKGGEAKALRQEPLKQWAIEEGMRLKGTPTERARKLMRQVPKNLSTLSEDPERVMREAIRKAEKNA